MPTPLQIILVDGVFPYEDTSTSDAVLPSAADGPDKMRRMEKHGKKGGGIVAGIFGFLAIVVAAYSWWEFFTAEPGLLIGVGVATVGLVLGIALWARHEEEGDLVFRTELLEDPIPAPHPSGVPPLVSLYARGLLIGDDGRVRPDAPPPANVDLRRRRLVVEGLNSQLVEQGLEPVPAKATGSPIVLEAAGYRYTHWFGRDVNVAALAERLRDAAWLTRCGIRKDRPYSNELHIVRLSPIDDAVPEPEQRWLGKVPPSRFGHPLDEQTSGTRCGVATELSGHGWLISVLNDPERARFRDPDGTLYRATGRPLLPDEWSCLDMRTDGQL